MSLVIVDDSDSSVQYSTPGGWIETGKVPQFKETTHASGTRGDTATLVFEGTSISVYGTLGANSGQSRLNFSIDGAYVDSYQAPAGPGVNNRLFWTSPDFDEASHKLVITVDQDASLSQQVNPLNSTFFLDYFIYQTTSTAGKTVVIDDTNPSITYSPKWSTIGSDTRLEGAFHLSNSQLDGAWAAVAFNGTGISLFGSLKDQGLKASVAIDGSQSGIIPQPENQNSLFDSGALSAGPHTINVTVLDGHSLVIDYFLVKNDSESPSVAPTTSGPGSTSTSSPGLASGASSVSGTPQVSKAPPIAAIVGGAVGGLFLLLLVLAGALLWRRRARRNNQPAFEYPVTSDPWAGKRISVTSLTTLTEDSESQRPRNFEKQRPPSRYMYYE
ncbi:hypothetical protein DFH08DRAFT_274667 [Mycena albidolilacea]|uniref:Transmembrane protein n=1 Tax=Mycena albidolilacea TaxID=1033008 RepID=A0AAD7APL6_9AGAR|nr:hypothetical protein DFH08DRAFT_274667 [Mycena albidolilacea]